MRSFRKRRRRVLMDAQLARNGFAGHAIRVSEDNTAAFGQRPRHAMAANLSFEIRPLIRSQDQGSNRTSRPLAIASLACSGESAILQSNELQFLMTRTYPSRFPS